jgi:hypothetical protein
MAQKKTLQSVAHLGADSFTCDTWSVAVLLRQVYF